MQSPIHNECSSVFPFQETGTDTFSLSRAKLFFFIFFIFFPCKGSSFFGRASKRRLADRIRCEPRHFYVVSYFRRTCFVHTRRPRTAWRAPTKAKVFSCNPLRDLRESRYKTSQAYFHLPQSRLQASAKRTHAHATRPFSNGTPRNQLRTHRIGTQWRTRSWLERTALTTLGYNVHMPMRTFSPNLDESRE